MGGLFGGRLSMAGNAVELVDVDDAHIAAVNDSGLHVTFDGTEHIVRMHAGRPDSIHAVPDLMIVFTKAQHTETALASARHLIGPRTSVLTLQNGLGGGERLARHVPAEHVLIGMTNWPADFGGPGRVASHGTGEVRLWSYDGKLRESVERTARAMTEAGLNCIADPAVMTAIWEKVVFNAVMNATAAVTGYSVGEIADSPHLHELAEDIVTEGMDVARSAGISLERERIKHALDFALGNHRGHIPSMLQDLRAGRDTEVDSINGAIAREASRLGRRAPINAALTHLVHALERNAGMRPPKAATPSGSS